MKKSSRASERNLNHISVLMNEIGARAASEHEDFPRPTAGLRPALLGESYDSRGRDDGLQNTTFDASPFRRRGTEFDSKAAGKSVPRRTENVERRPQVF